MGRALNVSSDWARVDEFPALLAEQTRRALADEAVGYSKERRAELESQLAAAERATKESKKKLTQLEKQRDAINKKFVEFAADKSNPENFRLIRSTPSRDEERKLLAREKGWY